MRLDLLLVKKGLCSGRERAKEEIRAGHVWINGVPETRASRDLPADAVVQLASPPLRYVSRGGLKLEKAMETFNIRMEGKVAADIGASTGGFTDCALQRGAAKVYAIDVGYGQLAWKLRSDSRVVNMERTNIRYVRPEDIGELLDFASIDVAFISLTKVLEPAKALLKDTGEIVALIKPQFEAGRGNVGKKGVVRDPAVHGEVIHKVLGYAKENGFVILGLDYSPIRGPEGNIEYLLYLGRYGEDRVTDVRGTVSEAHTAFDAADREKDRT
jgi:23S rRNA (cytidine1920-2'-O)/16S rRNA (cytidine1409-2'-O)-methyltransferase